VAGTERGFGERQKTAKKGGGLAAPGRASDPIRKSSLFDQDVSKNFPIHSSL